jgi:predicted ATPase
MAGQSKLSGNNRIIITGCPGSGKTSLIEALILNGQTGFPEIARNLIREGIEPPIWSKKGDSGRFFELILRQRILFHQSVIGAETAYFDRGIPDSLAYFKYLDKKPPEKLSRAIAEFRYHPVVFICPPWPDIYKNDPERRETFQEAEQLHAHTVEAYHECGYTLVELPRGTVAERLALVVTAQQNGR